MKSLDTWSETVASPVVASNRFCFPKLAAVVTSNGCRYDAPATGFSPNCRNCLVIYAAAVSNSGDPVARPFNSSDDRNLIWSKYLAASKPGVAAASRDAPAQIRTTMRRMDYSFFAGCSEPGLAAGASPKIGSRTSQPQSSPAFLAVFW